MKLKSQHNPPHFTVKILILLLLALAGQLCARAQTPAPTQTPTPPATEQVTSEAQDQPQSEPTPAENTDAAENGVEQKRLARARALAAIGRLAAAASELESLRAATKEDSVREVSRILLMAIFVEMPDYTRAATLLDEAYKAHRPGQADDEAMHSYFALAGQTVNSVRTHLERYRSFGVSVSDATALPPEANGDVEQLRGLLEKVVEQAKALHDEQGKGGEGTKGMDAAALLEDAATVRMRIARADDDRARWQSEVSDARQHLFSSEMRIASISDVPSARAAAATKQPAPSAAPPASADKTSQPKSEPKPTTVEQRTTDADQKSAKKSRQKSSEPNNSAASSTLNARPSQTPAQQPVAPTTPADSAGATAKNGGSPVSIGSLVGKAKQRVSPSYPPIARTARVSGVVTVYLVVNEKGEVESVERAIGPMQLQQAATDAARRWKFTPTVVDGQPVRVAGFLSFNFTL
ncbi:MAG TPA: TonB family protein [Pyrinomonadaceae bacterium]|nr:TonB family protein [Pyrinomonadaceae bacterium]